MNQNVKVSIAVVIIVVIGVVIGAALRYSNTNQISDQTNMDSNAELIQEDIKIGSGPAAQAGEVVTVHYTGTFENGEKFDSSLDRNEPFTFLLGAGSVIEGWDRGVIGMQAGGIRKLIIPPSLGYGPSDYGSIPGNSTLYFTIELLKIGV